MEETLLLMKDIHKKFPGVNALDGASFELLSGEVHALLGENGAGKSTLIKVLGGIYIADKGHVFINDHEVKISNVADANKYGISIIHQEIVLVPYMSIAENIFLGRELQGTLGFLTKKEMIKRAQKMIDSFGLKINALNLVYKLNPAEKQLVEIIKAVFFNVRILVMDEPTSSLTDKEVEFLFETIRKLKVQGVGIIYISHRLFELYKIADRITVMRDGRYVGTKSPKESEMSELINMMVGRKLVSYYVRTFNEMGEIILEVKGLNRKGVFSDISFKVRAGEILGFAGLIGAGRSEIMKAIFGIDPLDSGKILVNGRIVHIKEPADAIELGLAFTPEDRKGQGLVLKNTVKFNLILIILKKILKFIGINRKKENNIIKTYTQRLAIKISSPEQIVSNLSGGTQQKVVLAKWLANEPKLIIMDEPTRGVDVGAKAEIYSIMNDLAKNGKAIIMISSELPEIINMCDRICVVCGGKIKITLERDELSQEKIMHYATGV